MKPAKNQIWRLTVPSSKGAGVVLTISDVDETRHIRCQEFNYKGIYSFTVYLDKIRPFDYVCEATKLTKILYGFEE